MAKNILILDNAVLADSKFKLNKYTVELTILLSKMLQEDPHNRINLK